MQIIKRKLSTRSRGCQWIIFVETSCWYPVICLVVIDTIAKFVMIYVVRKPLQRPSQCCSIEYIMYIVDCWCLKHLHSILKIKRTVISVGLSDLPNNRTECMHGSIMNIKMLTWFNILPLEKFRTNWRETIHVELWIPIVVCIRSETVTFPHLSGTNQKRSAEGTIDKK